MQLSRCAGALGRLEGGSPRNRVLRATTERALESIGFKIFFQAMGAVLDHVRTLACLPRKEVIQPHLPVRLPCYDFTPLTLHTFDASAPCGFGRRLRVQTTRVV